MAENCSLLFRRFFFFSFTILNLISFCKFYIWHLVVFIFYCLIYCVAVSGVFSCLFTSWLAARFLVWLFFFKIYFICVHAHVHNLHMMGTFRCLERASDPWSRSYKPLWVTSCGLWKLNSSLFQKGSQCSNPWRRPSGPDMALTRSSRLSLKVNCRKTGDLGSSFR